MKETSSDTKTLQPNQTISDHNIEIQDSDSNNFFQINNFDDLIEKAKSLLTLIIAGGAILGATGFFIVNIYLGRFSSIQGFSVVSGRYVATVIWFLITLLFIGSSFILGGFLGKKLSLILNFVIGVILFIDFLFIFLLFEINIFSFIASIFMAGLIIGMILMILYGERGERKTYIQIVYIAFSVSVGSFTFLFSNIPQSLGGGQPADAILIFNDKAQFQDLPIEVISGTRQSEPIQILSELNDGLLIHDDEDNLTLIIKNDWIGAIIDASNPTPTPTPLQAVSGTAPMQPISGTTTP